MAALYPNVLVAIYTAAGAIRLIHLLYIVMMLSSCLKVDRYICIDKQLDLDLRQLDSFQRTLNCRSPEAQVHRPHKNPDRLSNFSRQFLGCSTVFAFLHIREWTFVGIPMVKLGVDGMPPGENMRSLRHHPMTSMLLLHICACLDSLATASNSK